MTDRECTQFTKLLLMIRYRYRFQFSLLCFISDTHSWELNCLNMQWSLMGQQASPILSTSIPYIFRISNLYIYIDRYMDVCHNLYLWYRVHCKLLYIDSMSNLKWMYCRFNFRFSSFFLVISLFISSFLLLRGKYNWCYHSLPSVYIASILLKDDAMCFVLDSRKQSSKRDTKEEKKKKERKKVKQGNFDERSESGVGSWLIKVLHMPSFF